MMRSGVVGVALLLVLAGCSGVVPGSGDDTPERSPYTVEDELDRQPTAEPSGDDETETSAAADYLAPGLTADGVEDPSLLLESHFSILERESRNGTYVVVSRENGTVNGTPISARRSRYVVRYPTAWYHSRTRIDYDDDTTDARVKERWVAGSRWLIRVNSTDDPVSYDAGNISGRPGHPPILRQQLAQTLSTVTAARSDVTVAERVRNDTAWYVVTGSRRTGDTITTYTFHVREDGFIERRFTERIVERSSAEPRIYDARLTFEIDEDGTLERPGWYETAREAVADETSTNDDDERAVMHPIGPSSRG